jgi:hypothetical protein
MLPLTMSDSFALSAATGVGSGGGKAAVSAFSTCAWLRSKARARSRKLRVKSVLVPAAATLTSLRAASKPNMLTSTFHWPAVMPSTRNAPFSSVTVSRMRSPCVAFTVAPGTGCPSAFTLPEKAPVCAMADWARTAARHTPIKKRFRIIDSSTSSIGARLVMG